MRTILASLMIFVAMGNAQAAEDYGRIPPNISAQIKAKCVGQYPDDYVMQSGCIRVQSEGYIEVHGDEAPAEIELNLDGIPSAFDRAQINNSAYLTVAKAACKIDVGTMPDQYLERAIASDRLNSKQVREMIAGVMREQLADAKKDPKAFCAQANANLPNFVADLEN